MHEAKKHKFVVPNLSEAENDAFLKLGNLAYAMCISASSLGRINKKFVRGLKRA